jgi:phosphoglycolate phosphatase
MLALADDEARLREQLAAADIERNSFDSDERHRYGERIRLDQRVKDCMITNSDHTLPLADGVVFDLDGTLWDTTEACAAGWNEVARRHCVPFRRIEAADVRAVVGKPHEACIREVFVGISEGHVRALIEETPEEDNRMVARLGGVLFPDVPDILRRLQQDLPLFIVSNCQAGYIETFLDCTGFAGIFRDFECWGNTRRPKADNLRALVERNGLRAPVYVGDTEGDATAARACGVPFVHVSYGFGGCEAPDFRVSRFSELTGIVAPRRV